MRAVIDTDVIAAVLLAQPKRHEEAARLVQLCDEMLAPSHLKAELGNVPVYDTLFVELAVRERVPMASYDQGLRKKFPDVVAAPASLIERARR